MKKFTLVLVFIMMLSCISFAHAEEGTFDRSGNYKYILLEDGTAQITMYYGDEDTVLYIPSELDGFTVSSIGEDAFADCYYITEIIIPDSVTSIGPGAFNYCEDLTKISIPESVTSIGDYAFSHCYSLTEVTIPDRVIYIGECPFLACDSLRKITVSQKNKSFASIEGVLFDKENKKLLCYPAGRIAETFEIPKGIKSIGKGAFIRCALLTEITIPDSVKSIGEMAFGGCISLTEITISKKLTSIGESAFANCNSLTDIIIPKSVNFIGDHAFDYCDSITLSVKKGSYAMEYAEENGIPYTYPGANNWLN